MKKTNKKAVIYCRVSSVKQAKEGHGIDSQETRCREYSGYKGYDVAEVFQDEAVSGGMIDRPGMQSMLKFLKKHRSEQMVVIIDDISRLARGLEAHLQLRAAIADAGGKLESPSIEFGEDSDSMLVENLLASVSQHQRQKNAEQVVNRMRARVTNGYWCFYPAVGYKYQNVPGHGKMLVRDEPAASVVKEALEGYASGRFETQSEVLAFLENAPGFPRLRRKYMHFQFVQDLLTRALYAGYMDVKQWGLKLHPGKHEPLISFTTYQAIQDRLNGLAKAPAAKNISNDFPLRGFVTCGCCGEPMTACWTQGRKEKYPYYLCYGKGCPERGKSIRRQVIESEFEKLLMELRPSQDLFYMAVEMFRDLWEARGKTVGQSAQALKAELQKVERKVEQFLNRVVETDNAALVATYENQISKLEAERVALSEKIKNCGRPLKSFDDSFRTAFKFLANPHEIWVSGGIEGKRTVLKLAFAEKLAYVRNQGFRTAAKAPPFLLLEDLKQGKGKMVEATGVEPATP